MRTHHATREQHRARAATIYLHLATATAVLVLMEPQFIPRSATLVIGMVVATVGALRFGMRSRALLWVFPSAMLATALWSSSPGFTALSSTAIIIPVVLAGVVVAISEPDRFMRALAVWVRVGLVVSFALFFLRPDLGAQFDGLYDGAMRGLFAHKNGLARLLIVGVFAELFTRQKQSSRIFWLASLLFAAYFTRSASFFVLVGVIIFGAAYLLLITSRKKATAAAAIGFTPLLVVLIGAVAFIYGDDLVEESGRFSGEGDRGRIWLGVVTLWRMRHVEGWGFGQVFRPDTEAGHILYSVVGWVPTAGHSGYMNALAEGGYIGITAMLLTLASAIAITWRNRHILIWPFIWAVALTLNNITDTRISSVEWFLLAVGVLYVSRKQDDHVLRARKQSLRGRTERGVTVQ